jgi:hypothetical protein
MENALGVLNMRILIMLISLALCFSANAGGNLSKGLVKSAYDAAVQTERKTYTSGIIGKDLNFKQFQNAFYDNSIHKNNSNNKSLFVHYFVLDSETNTVLDNFITSGKINIKGEYFQYYAKQRHEHFEKKFGRKVHFIESMIIFNRKEANQYKNFANKTFLGNKDVPQFKPFGE